MRTHIIRYVRQLPTPLNLIHEARAEYACGQGEHADPCDGEPHHVVAFAPTEARHVVYRLQGSSLEEESWLEYYSL